MAPFDDVIMYRSNVFDCNRDNMMPAIRKGRGYIHIDKKGHNGQVRRGVVVLVLVLVLGGGGGQSFICEHDLKKFEWPRKEGSNL